MMLARQMKNTINKAHAAFVQRGKILEKRKFRRKLKQFLLSPTPNAHEKELAGTWNSTGLPSNLNLFAKAMEKREEFDVHLFNLKISRELAKKYVSRHEANKKANRFLFGIMGVTALYYVYSFKDSLIFLGTSQALSVLIPPLLSTALAFLAVYSYNIQKEKKFNTMTKSYIEKISAPLEKAVDEIEQNYFKN